MDSGFRRMTETRVAKASIRTRRPARRRLTSTRTPMIAAMMAPPKAMAERAEDRR